MNKCLTHKFHDSMPINVDLAGLTATMVIYNFVHYGNTDGYCTGDDEVSRGIYASGTWEPYGLALTREICHGHAGETMLDIGAHIGTYSILAALEGLKVTALEGDEENCKLLENNARLNNVTELINVVNGWIESDKTVPVFPFVFPKGIRLAKIDIEGNEAGAIRSLSHNLSNGSISYVLMEASPVFNDSYPAIVQQMNDWGYDSFLVPDTATMPIGKFREAPLGQTRNYPIKSDELNFDQRDILFELRK